MTICRDEIIVIWSAFFPGLPATIIAVVSTRHALSCSNSGLIRAARGGEKRSIFPFPFNTLDLIRVSESAGLISSEVREKRKPSWALLMFLIGEGPNGSMKVDSFGKALKVRSWATAHLHRQSR